MKNKILLIGSSSFIGKRLFKTYSNFSNILRTSSIEQNGCFLLDLNNPLNFDFKNIDKFTYVIFLAAISSPDECSNNYERVKLINVDGTIKFIEKAIEKGSKVIFFSSDAVYGNLASVANDIVEPSPLGEYAEMKLQVEKYFNNADAFKAIRLSYVFSKDDKFTNYLKYCSKSGDIAKIFHPFCRSIIYINDVVEGVFNLTKIWGDIPSKVINFGGNELLSRVDLAYLIQKYALKDLKFEIIETDSEFFKKRAKIIEMKSEILPAILGRQPLRIADAIQFEFGY